MPKLISPKQYWLIVVLAIYSLLLLLNAVLLVDWLPSCPIKNNLGIECLGCGINRAGTELLRGNFQAAFDFNPLIFLYCTLFIGWIANKINNIITNQKQKSYEQI